MNRVILLGTIIDTGEWRGDPVTSERWRCVALRVPVTRPRRLGGEALLDKQCVWFPSIVESLFNFGVGDLITVEGYIEVTMDKASPTYSYAQHQQRIVVERVTRVNVPPVPLELGTTT